MAQILLKYDLSVSRYKIFKINIFLKTKLRLFKQYLFESFCLNIIF
jgi:hypothetical protein